MLEIQRLIIIFPVLDGQLAADTQHSFAVDVEDVHGGRLIEPESSSGHFLIGLVHVRIVLVLISYDSARFTKIINLYIRYKIFCRHEKYPQKFSTRIAHLKILRIFAVLKTNMVPIVQLVRASDCGSECRGFESHWAPPKEVFGLPFFVYICHTHPKQRVIAKWGLKGKTLCLSIDVL